MHQASFCYTKNNKHRYYVTKIASEILNFTTFADTNTHSIMEKYCVLLFLALLACNQPSINDDPRIRKAESVVWDTPDSALSILATIDTLRLDSRQQMHYSLVRIQARNKAGYDISGEEKIFELKEYYADGKDAAKAAKAAFYAGRVHQLRGDDKSAAQSYLDALRYIEKTGDRQLNGLIHINLGMLHYEQRHLDEAIDEFKKSLLYFSPNTDYTSLALNKIGSAYVALQQADSARIYFERALVSARQGNNIVLLSNILQDMGILFEESGNYPEAKKYYQKAASLTEEQNRAVLYLNLGWIYFHTDKLDSADFYAGQTHNLLNNGNIYSLVSVYELLYHVEKAKGKHPDALAWHEQYADSLFIVQERKNDLAIMELTKQYETKLLAGKIQRRNQAIVLILFVALLVVLIVYIVMNKRNVRKNRIIEELNRKMVLFEGMAGSIQEHKHKAALVQGLEEKVVAYNKERTTYRDIAQLYFNVLKKGAVIETNLDSEEKKASNILKKINKVVFEADEFDWNKLFLTLNTLEDGFPEKARVFFERYPNLTGTDFRVWCLSYAGFSQQEIVLLLKLNLRDIQRRITKIREAFGIEKREDIYPYVKNNVDKTPEAADE